MHEIGKMLQHPIKAIIEIVFDSLSVVMCMDHECILKFEKHEVSWALPYTHNIGLNHYKAFLILNTLINDMIVSE